MKNLILLGAASLLFLACRASKNSTDKGKVASESQMSDKEAAVVEKAGSVLYTQNCGQCHELFAPSSHTPTEWKKWVDVMQGNTSLSDAEAAVVLAYLQENAKPE